MLAAFLLNRMTINNTKRRNTAVKQAESPGKQDLNASQSDLCRTCLITTKLRSIFCNSDHEQMSCKIKLVTGLEIRKDDGLSQKICQKCLRTIDVNLNFRIKCKKAEKSLLEMVKTDIKTESSNNNKSIEYSYAEDDIKQIKVELEDDTSNESTNFQQDVKTESLKDIKLNIHKINQDIQPSVNRDEKSLKKSSLSFDRVNIPIEWDRNIPSSNEKLRNKKLSIDGKISKPLKATPKTPAQRQKEYRERLKHQNDDKLRAMKTKSAESVLAHRHKMRILQEKRKAIPPRAQRVRRIYTRHVIPGPPFKCDSCHKEFANRTSYVSHARFHTTYIVCEECGKIFRNNFALQQHQRAMHGHDKIHKCGHCDYSAATKDALTVHERRHAGSRPYVCDYCAASFYTRRTLIQHIGVHMPATIQCPICPKRLRSLRMLSNHKAKAHGKRYSFQCPRCPKASREKKYIRRHLAKVHQLPREQHPPIERMPIEIITQTPLADPPPSPTPTPTSPTKDKNLSMLSNDLITTRGFTRECSPEALTITGVKSV